MLAQGLVARTRSWRCLLVLLLGVAAVVVGLLAMHVLSGSNAMPPAASASAHAASGHTGSTAVSMNDVAHSTRSPALPGDSGCASGGCKPSHDMTAMVCTLALLGGVLVLIVPALARRLHGMGSSAAPGALPASFVHSLWLLPPPSLLVLSVDRR